MCAKTPGYISGPTSTRPTQYTICRETIYTVYFIYYSSSSLGEFT